MTSPFQKISDVFRPATTSTSASKPDGSILLTLTGAEGVAVKRFISAEQWRDQQQLQRLITSLQVSLAIERGEQMPPRALHGGLQPARCSGFSLTACRLPRFPDRPQNNNKNALRCRSTYPQRVVAPGV